MKYFLLLMMNSIFTYGQPPYTIVTNPNYNKKLLSENLPIVNITRKEML